jgi:hypothetical protein
MAKRTVVILFSLFLANLLSSFLLGFFMSYGGNIQMVGINEILFEPQITIAYMMLFYFLVMYFQPSVNSQLPLFLLTLFLSFTTNFIQGTFFLVGIIFLLKKFKVV